MHHHHDPGRSGRRGLRHDPVRGRVDPAVPPVRRPGHRCHRRYGRRAVRGRHARCDDVHGRADAHRGRGGPAARADHQTDDQGAARDVPRCRRADWPAGRRRDRIDPRCPNEDAPRPDRRRREGPSAPRGARNATYAEAQGVIRRGGRAEPEGRLALCWPGRRRPRRPLDDAGADHGAGGAPRRALQPSAAVVRHPSARAPTVHRNTDCRHHRHRGTACRWCGCGEWGVCVRSFENCEWYGGLRSDLKGSATPQQA